MGKRETRPDAWARLCDDMSDALSGLIEMKDDFETWRDNLPPGLDETPTAEKLDAVLELDLDNIQSEIDEIAETELPMGFGRD